MKLRTLVFLFFPVAAACVLCYAFIDISAANFSASLSAETTRIFELITRLGLSDPYLIVSALCIIWFGFVQKKPSIRNAAIFIFAAVALAGLGNDLIKCLVGRSRPKLLLSNQIYGFHPFAFRYEYHSFPSGHSNTVAAFCYSLFALRNRLWYVYLIVALAVMASRVVLNAHYPSDVLFGAYLGILITELIREALQKKGMWISAASESTPHLSAKGEDEI
jgi:membrane-associated phospholipid phosphatase